MGTRLQGEGGWESMSDAFSRIAFAQSMSMLLLAMCVCVCPSTPYLAVSVFCLLKFHLIAGMLVFCSTPSIAFQSTFLDRGCASPSVETDLIYLFVSFVVLSL